MFRYDQFQDACCCCGEEGRGDPQKIYIIVISICFTYNKCLFEGDRAGS